MGKDVEINLTDDLLRVSCDDKDIAIHKRIKDRGNFSTVDSHYPRYKKIAKTEYREVYRAKMATEGPYSEKLFSLIVKNSTDRFFESGPSASAYSYIVLPILKYLKDHPQK